MKGTVDVELLRVSHVPSKFECQVKRGISVTPSGDAVVVRNAVKAYKSGQPVLKGLNMTVPCGSIGGQQRRVSLLVALLSQPDLLILDEPTFGVDPITRCKIWKYLRKLVSEKRTTVIITTHYIEECRSADNIGVIRNGTMIEERQISSLMKEYETNNLEKIVLSLSRKDEKQSQIAFYKHSKLNCTGDVRLSLLSSAIKMAQVKRPANSGSKDSFNRIRALTTKNFLTLSRNPILLGFFIIVAALLVSRVCLSLGSDPKHLRLGLVNYESANDSNCDDDIMNLVVGRCSTEMLSCRYLKSVNEDDLTLIQYYNEAAALDSVHSGYTWGYILFQQNFSNGFLERMLVSRNSTNDALMQSSEILIRLDETNKQIANRIKRTFYESFENFVSTLLSDCGYDPRQGESVFKYQKPIFGTERTEFREFLAPASVVLFWFFFPIMTTAIHYIKEKKSSVLQRSIASGVSVWEIFVSYTLSEFFVLLLQSVLNYSVIRYLFGIDVLGSTPLLLLLFLLAGNGGVVFGFLLGYVCTDEIQAAIIGLAAFIPNMSLSGALWPKEGMTEAVQYAVQILPCTLSSESARSIISRGWEFTHPNVWPGFAVLSAYTLLGFIVTIIFHLCLRK